MEAAEGLRLYPNADADHLHKVSAAHHGVAPGGFLLQRFRQSAGILFCCFFSSFTENGGRKAALQRGSPAAILTAMSGR